jgi:endonuclease YncB( thermonuclease family)
LISEDILKNKSRADYGTDLLEKLSGDLGVSERTLNRALQFYRKFPISSASTKLSWSHYSALLSIKDKEKRDSLIEKSIKKEWTTQQLEDAVHLENLKYTQLKIEELQEKPTQSSAKLPTTRLRLYTYKILEPSYIHPEAEFSVVDLGFNINIKAELRGISKPKQDDIIESIKTNDNYSFKRSDAKPKELYTYKALVERVIDADTFWLNIDLGFNSWYREKVRLRGIDAPELSTKEGQDAKKFVESKLKEVDFIVIKTYNEPDKYERYLAEIFYQAQETEPQKVLEQGVFLNQELLDLGFAKIME